MALVLCAAASAATISTKLSVTNAVLSLGVATSLSGPATLTNIGNGTFSSPSLAVDSGGNYSGAFTITLAGADKINGTLKIPAAAIAAAATGGTITGSATVTGGAGTYAGATGSFASLSGTGSIGLTGITLSFSGDGTITTGGGGPVGPPTPTIDTVQNNYGLIAPGLPNYGLAPSTLFFIKGTGLSNTTTDLLSSASPGLQTTVSGVTVSVTSGGTTLQCPLYYLLPTQVAAVLPGATPLGNATITVTNNGGTSAAYPIVVVQSAFGILSYNGSLAAAYDANNTIITATNAANPNQAIVLWGSGVGRDPADDDKLYPQAQNNLTGIPMQAFVGGVQATIAYRGRSQFPGVDQVVLTIPGSVPTGCYVSLAIVSGNIVSNSVTIPIAASGRTCSDSNSGLTPDLIQGLSGKTTVKFGALTVAQVTSISAGKTSTDGIVGGSFFSVPNSGNSSAGSGQVSIGSCLVNTPTTSSSTTIPNFTGLDAGASISVAGPAGSLTLSQQSSPIAGISLAGIYSTPTGVVPATFIPSSGGTFTFDNGSGGKDVQHFNTTLTLPAAFTWSNASQISAVSRTQGVTVTWTGGASGTYVDITGGSTAVINGKSVSVSFVCNAPISAGQFTVPVPVLLALPAGSGSLSVGSYSNQQLFTATGLDYGVAAGYSDTSKSPITYN